MEDNDISVVDDEPLEALVTLVVLLDRTASQRAWDVSGVIQQSVNSHPLVRR